MKLCQNVHLDKIYAKIKKWVMSGQKLSIGQFLEKHVYTLEGTI